MNAPPARLSAWDPICAAASELKATFVEPTRARVFEALRVLKDVSGVPPEVEDDLAVDAFAFVVVDLLARDAGLRSDRRDTLLHLLAAQIFHSPRNPSITNREFFWNFLNELAGEYRGSLSRAGRAPTLHVLLDRFLHHYRLHGEENADVVDGLDRLLAPLVEVARRVLQDRQDAIND
ncbi:MAG: hypothetical protein HZB55_05960 [Deltaproteobacteria bacterium]|nr:hypothetical protein [Deltaproteobacteria bacterium]